MPLIRACCNHQEQLSSLVPLHRSLLEEAARSPRPSKVVRLRSGAIERAVVRVLDDATGPMSVSEVHSAIEAHFAMPVSRNSVSGCLAENAVGAEAHFRRVKRGVYEFRR